MIKSFACRETEKLERYFGIEARFWLNLQIEFDLRKMKRKIGADIERRILPAKNPGKSIQQNVSALAFMLD